MRRWNDPSHQRDSRESSGVGGGAGRLSTLGSTAAETAAVITVAMADMTADFTRPPSRKGGSVPSVFYNSFDSLYRSI
jgi:hypothetical protein